MFKKALALIEKYQTIIIHRHTNPDGDAIGSQVGMQQLIKENYPNKNVYIVGDDAKRYSFMEGCTPDNVTDDMYADALAIVLDTSAKFLISDTRYTLAKETLRFDHHIHCEDICNLDVVDTSYESCCGLVTAFAVENNLAINKLAAKSLYTGMVTDSGRFRYDSTSGQTHRLAAVLLDVGVDTNELYTQLYSDNFENIKLRASYVLKVRFSPANTAYICTTKEELANSGADEFTISRGMVGVMSEIKGVHVWVNFTQTDRGVLCELRSNKYNINPIAVKYGGGGHQKASGATVPDFDTAMQMLADLDKLQGEN